MLVEIFQTIVLSIGALLIAYLGFTKVAPEALTAAVAPDWGSLLPVWHFKSPDGATEYELFGLLLMIWVFKGMLLSFSGPEQLYDFQRFLAARTPKEASKLGALWGAIHTVRWPMAMALAAMGILGLAKQGDPEKVLPSVIQDMLPTGVRGIVLAALLSGFLASFNSTVNGGASYIVKDIYHKYLNPRASQRQLILASYASSALLVLMGIAVSFASSSINQMFTWIMGTLGAGVLLPNVLRWYWWRINGWSYAAGTFSGMVLSLIQALVPAFSKLPLYETFPAIAGAVLLITVAVALLTEPTDRETLLRFYRQVRPAGFWKPIADETGLAREANAAFGNDMMNVVIGIPWLIAMWLCPVYLVLHRFAESGTAFAVVAALSVVLYKTWYLRLTED